MLWRRRFSRQLQRVHAVNQVEDEAVGWEVHILEAAKPVEGAQVHFILEQQGPVLATTSGPNADGDLRRTGDGSIEVGEIKEAEVKVLGAWSAAGGEVSACGQCRDAPYHGPFLNLANVDGFLLAIDVKREEGVGEPRVEGVFEATLAGGGRGISKTGTSGSVAGSGRRRAQILGREGMMEARGAAQSFELRGALDVEGSIVDRVAAEAGEGKVPQGETAQVPDLAVLGQQERSRRLGRHGCMADHGFG
jgi:hypothetical protein